MCRALVVGVIVAAASGCTSAISTAYLRDTLWDFSEHASEGEPAAATVAEADEGAGTDDVAETFAIDAERRKAAVDEAVARLARLGTLDPAARETLVETLQRTQQEDWPVVVEAFVSSLESTRVSADGFSADRVSAESVAAPEADLAAYGDRAAEAEPAATHVVAKADLDAPEANGAATGAESPAASTPQSPAADAAATPVKVVLVAASREPSSVVQPPVAERPVAPAPPVASAPPVTATFAVRNPCFATRVQAWGVLDRFPEPRFRRGQELIVYFELDNLSSGQSPAGHTTCIDTTLSLVAADGGEVRRWTFEPIAETCAAKRRDYFARYVIRIPDEAPPGGCRIDIAVVDTLAGVSSQSSLPLEVVADSR